MSIPNPHSLGRIQMANDLDGKNKIKQAAIVNMLKSEVLTASNPLSVQETDIDRAARIMLNYFRAIDDLFVNGRDRKRDRRVQEQRDILLPWSIQVDIQCPLLFHKRLHHQIHILSH